MFNDQSFNDTLTNITDNIVSFEQQDPELNQSVIVSRGYYPKGGGEVFVKVYPAKELTAVTMKDPGKVKRIYGRAFVAGVLPIRVRVFTNAVMGLYGMSHIIMPIVNSET